MGVAWTTDKVSLGLPCDDGLAVLGSPHLRGDALSLDNLQSACFLSVERRASGL